MSYDGYSGNIVRELQLIGYTSSIITHQKAVPTESSADKNLRNRRQSLNRI